MIESTGFTRFGRGFAHGIKACALDAHEGHAVRTDCVDSRDADLVPGCFDGIMHTDPRQGFVHKKCVKEAPDFRRGRN